MRWWWQRKRVEPSRFRFDYFKRDAASHAVEKIVARWDAAGTPVEERLAEALFKLQQSYDDRLRLQWRVHCQRRSLRENWEIVESRNNSLGSPLARRSYVRLAGWYREAKAEIVRLKAMAE